VKQGAIVSPILFCVYYDNLLLALCAEGAGCHVGCWFLGVLAYADDIVLLAPTASAMRRMLSICDSPSNTLKVSFNASKSKCLLFRSRRMKRYYSFESSAFVIGGKDIEFVDKWSHLGHVINVQLEDDDDIYNCKTVMIGPANNWLCSFPVWIL
jgi:hypothetical protein